MNNKKAFEVQFNWIFVLVVGASILIFFAALAIKQKNVSESAVDVTILKSVQSIVNSAMISTDTTKEIDIPDSRIGVSCNKISVGISSKQYGNLILFAPSLVSGDKLLTKTSTFSMPYKVANFLYMTSPDIRYVLVDNSGGDLTALANQVNKLLPQGLKKEFHADVPILEDEKNYKVKFVFFGEIDGSVLASFGNMADEDVTAIKIKEPGDEEMGSLDFYKKSGASFEFVETSYYMGLNSLIGAVYADELNTYECGMRNAFARLNLITDVYIKRSIELADYYIFDNPVCAEIYQSPSLYSLLDTIKYSSEFSEANINRVIEAADQLELQNQNAQLNSCSLIY